MQQNVELMSKQQLVLIYGNIAKAIVDGWTLDRIDDNNVVWYKKILY